MISFFRSFTLLPHYGHWPSWLPGFFELNTNWLQHDLHMTCPHWRRATAFWWPSFLEQTWQMKLVLPSEESSLSFSATKSLNLRLWLSSFGPLFFAYGHVIFNFVFLASVFASSPSLSYTLSVTEFSGIQKLVLIHSFLATCRMTLNDLSFSSAMTFCFSYS